jgi:threonine-phosphate decarboxylase
MEHGGDLLTYENQFGGKLIDFSSNINPLGPPEGLDKYLMKKFETLRAYPDIQYRKSKKSISTYLKCNAVEIIDDFMIMAHRVIVCTPSFSEYEQRAKVHGKDVVRVPYKKDFTLDVKAIEDILTKGDLLLLGNPNNPTGLRIKENELIALYKLVLKKGGYLLLDEAFYEFCPHDYDSIEIFKKFNYEEVGIIRAATKFFALPGLRLGYGCASSHKAQEIRKISLPWSINSFADAAGQYIFKDLEYIEESKKYIDKERIYLQDELSKIPGILPKKTDANFILLELVKWNEEYVFNNLLKQGILVRKCNSFIDLPSNYIRVAIKSRKDNEMLIKALKAITIHS